MAARAAYKPAGERNNRPAFPRPPPGCRLRPAAPGPGGAGRTGGQGLKALAAFALLFGAGGCFGLAPSLARIGVTGGIPPMGYVFWMGLGAMLASLAAARLRGFRPRFARPYVVYYLCSGCTRIVAGGFVMYTVLGHVPAGVFAIVLATAPLMTWFARLALGHERFAGRRALGICLGLAGVGFLFGPKTALPDPSAASWLALGFLVPTLYTVSNLTIERLRPAGADSLSLTAGMLVTVAATAAVLALALGQFHPLWRVGAALPEVAMFTHSLTMACAFLALYEVVRRTDATFGGQVSYVSTIAGIVFGMVLLGERPSAWVWAAMACILAGVYQVGRAPQPCARRSARGS